MRTGATAAEARSDLRVAMTNLRDVRIEPPFLIHALAIGIIA
jgi:hypothetical protein